MTMKTNVIKTVIINRAVPGTGKTTISRCITQALENAGLIVRNHSTDDFFMQNGRYCFDIEKLHTYHELNLAYFHQDLESGADVVICDNTNIKPWHSEPYTDLARQYGYQVVFLNMTPRELSKHVQSQIITAEKPDAHGVPEETLKRLIREFNDYNSLLDQTTAIDAGKHYHYYWDDAKCMAIASGAARHFDYDTVVTIRPEEYHQAKLDIGEKFLTILHQNEDCCRKKSESAA